MQNTNMEYQDNPVLDPTTDVRELTENIVWHHLVAEKTLDEQYGEGFARKNPVIWSSIVQSSVIHESAMWRLEETKAILSKLDEICNEIDGVRGSIYDTSEYHQSLMRTAERASKRLGKRVDQQSGAK